MDGFLLRAARPGDVDAVVEFWSGAGENAGRPPDRAEHVHLLVERIRVR